MTIDFSCPRCGAPFTVDARFAGKTGRCKTCRHQMTIPSTTSSPSAPVAATGMFRLPTVPPVSQGAGPSGGGPMFPSSAALMPLTEEVRPVLGKGSGQASPKKQYSFNPDLLLENSRPGSTYQLVASHKVLPPVSRELGAKPPGPLTRLWRGQARAVLGVVRQLSDLVYLLTIPCIMLILVAIVLGRRDLAVLGATGVIVLSLIRLALEGVALVAGPFKESPLQGILFLIPPFTFWYLYKHPKRTKKAIGRVLAPMGWILAVVLAFAFIPTLSEAEPDEGTSALNLDRARAGVEGLKADVDAELEGQGLSTDQLRSSETGQRVGQAIGEMKSRVREGVGQARDALRKGAEPAPEP